MDEYDANSFPFTKEEIDRTERISAFFNGEGELTEEDFAYAAASIKESSEKLGLTVDEYRTYLAMIEDDDNTYVLTMPSEPQPKISIEQAMGL